MAQDDEPRSAGGSDSIDEWIEREPPTRPLRPRSKRQPPPPRLVRELEQLYHEEAQGVEHRLQRVWRQLEQHPTMQQSRQRATFQSPSIFPFKRRKDLTQHPASLPSRPRSWSIRASALAAVVLLVVLVGGLTAGLILVRRGNTNVQATKSPTVGVSPTSTSTPTIINNINIADIEMRDATTGWAIGYATPFVSGGQTQILHTTDGGVHWRVVTPQPSLLDQSSHALLQPNEDVSFVRTEQFLNGSAAWILYRPDQLFGTSDGGQTWHQYTLPGQGIRQFAFLDELNGWVTSEDGTDTAVFRTSDSGATWTKISGSASSLPSLERSRGLSFLNLTTGWAVYINQASSNTDSVYITQDGGVTWQPQQVTVPAGVAQPAFPDPPLFFNDQDGIMRMEFPNNGSLYDVLYMTHNGGLTWQSPIVVQFKEFMDFVDILHGYALNAYGSALLSSSDSGRHWSTVPTSANFVEMSGLNFVSSQVGWALKYNQADGNNLLLQTVDAGRTWTQVDTQFLK